MSYTELKDLHTERLLSKDVSIDTIFEIQDLYRALQKLPSAQREALILFEINGWSIKEIASLQKSSESAIKTKLHRGRKKLKKILEQLNKTPKQFITAVKSIIL